MLIPVKCFTCGKVIGNKYNYYLKEIVKRKEQLGEIPQEIQYLDDKSIDKTIEGVILDELKLKDMCCRRHLLTHVNIF
jgi:DNA-directed RNA polymerase subunit N (RpoN/RPB10)